MSVTVTKELLENSYPQKSISQIAKMCHVSHGFISGCLYAWGMSQPIHISQGRKRKIIGLYTTGSRVSEIADGLNITRSAVYACLKSNHIKLRSPSEQRKMDAMRAAAGDEIRRPGRPPVTSYKDKRSSAVIAPVAPVVPDAFDMLED